MMTNKEKNALSSKWGAANYTFGGDTGSTKTGFLESSMTSPYGGANVGSSSSNPPLIGSTPYSRFDNLVYPRAIMSKVQAYNAPSNIPVVGQLTYASSEYYS